MGDHNRKQINKHEERIAPTGGDQDDEVRGYGVHISGLVGDLLGQAERPGKPGLCS